MGQKLCAPLCDASCLPDHFSQRARKRAHSTQHFSGGWQKRNNKSESTLEEAVGGFSTGLLPSPLLPLVRMPELPSCVPSTLDQAHSRSVWPHGDT